MKNSVVNEVERYMGNSIIFLWDVNMITNVIHC